MNDGFGTPSIFRTFPSPPHPLTFFLCLRCGMTHSFAYIGSDGFISIVPDAAHPSSRAIDRCIPCLESEGERGGAETKKGTETKREAETKRVSDGEIYYTKRQISRIAERFAIGQL